MAEILFGDFETRSPVDLKKSGADVYARHPVTRVMAFGYAFGDEDATVLPMGARPSKRVASHIANGGLMVAHNAPFEWLIWNLVYKRQFPDLPHLSPEQLICTMALAYSMALPGSLEFALAAAGVDMQKDMEGHRVMMQLCKPKEVIEKFCQSCSGTGDACRFGGQCEACGGSGDMYVFLEPDDEPVKFERMYKYCGVDIGAERLLYKRLVKLSAKEKELWRLDHKINQRGVSVDLLAVENAIEVCALQKTILDKEIREVTDNAVATCSAVQQLTDWLKFRGVECDGVAKNDVADILANPDLPADCRRALELRQEAAKSSNAKLPAILRGVCNDGRIRGLFQYHGAGTGRWAGRRIQLQNLPRPRLKQKEIEDVFRILRSI